MITNELRELLERAAKVLERTANDTLDGRNMAEELRALLDQPPEPQGDAALIDKFSADNPEEWARAVAHTEALDSMYAARDALVRLGDEPRALDRLYAAIHAMENPPCDAADMGGQAGEEVEVVAYIGRESRMTTEGWEDGHEYVVLAEHASDADKRYDAPLMTVAQHRRLIAAERQRAEGMAEALRGMLQLDEENHQRYSGDEDVCLEVRTARQALTAWEVKHA